jgi:host cell surface-exposed lipoprotein
MGKYEALRGYLVARGAEEDVTVGFDDIATLVGGLPRSAYERDAWWTDATATHPHVAAWNGAGRTVVGVDREKQIATFRRVAALAESVAAAPTPDPAPEGDPSAALPAAPAAGWYGVHSETAPGHSVKKKPLYRRRWVLGLAGTLAALTVLGGLVGEQPVNDSAEISASARRQAPHPSTTASADDTAATRTPPSTTPPTTAVPTITALPPSPTTAVPTITAPPPPPTSAPPPPTTATPATVPPTSEGHPAGETVSQRNARQKAAEYLDLMAFSRSGLIEQLVFEGFTQGDAAYGVDALNVDWNEQAAKKAAEYLDLMSFSRSGLIEQLVFEGFSQVQAEYGVSTTGL